MATAGGPGHPSLIPKEIEGALRKQPYTFRFFQAVRLLTRMYSDRKEVGRFVSPSGEVVAFCAHQSLGFPASEIQQLEFPDGGPPRMTINFFGLTGPSGVLPLVYTEFVRRRIRGGDRTMAAFFDIFNHRMLSLFYAAWEKYRFSVSYERGGGDTVSPHLMELIGMGTPGLRRRLSVDDDSLLFLAGLLTPHARSAVSLRSILEDYFGVPVAIRQFVGAWFRLDRNTQCEIGGGSFASQELGKGAVVGDEVWDYQAGVRIVMGPLTLEQYLDFLPTGSAYRPLRDLVHYYSDGQQDFELQLVLKRDEVPQCELGSESVAGPRLGWVAWATTKDMDHDPDETTLKL